MRISILLQLLFAMVVALTTANSISRIRTNTCLLPGCTCNETVLHCRDADFISVTQLKVAENINKVRFINSNLLANLCEVVPCTIIATQVILDSCKNLPCNDDFFDGTSIRKLELTGLNFLENEIVIAGSHKFDKILVTDSDIDGTINRCINPSSQEMISAKLDTNVLFFSNVTFNIEIVAGTFKVFKLAHKLN